MVIIRQVHDRLKALLSRFPSVALLGPRQVGKTTLAEQVADELGHKAVYVDLELPSDRAKLSDPELYFAAHEKQLVILDEIHRAPGIFQTLRSIIDRRRRKGQRTQQFLFLGSASIDLLKQSAESLAGRIAYLELTPFLISEIDGAEQHGAADRLWVRGGFPDSYLAPDDAGSFDWRLAFIQTYLERDLPALGPRLPTETVRRFWQMLAHSQGQMLNAARLAAGLGVSGQTVARYLDTLVDLLLVRRLQPWTANASKRLVRSPKVYVRDTGVAHALLNIPDQETLLGHPVAGPSWEGFVIENLIAAAPAGAKPWFYRTAEGAEIDLLLELGAGGRWAIEVKRSLSNPAPSKGFHLASDDVKATRRLVVYPGKEPYRIDAKTEVTPLDRLVRSLNKAGDVAAGAS
ncbi:MAG TPA: ATP-binding protein [Bryobacteraceae bacterium]|nr:ATP-binding protein [Bryobacteraceae bacterium]